MTTKLNPGWLAAALFWAGALMISYTNIHTIQEIATVREKNDRLRQEMSFRDRNAEQLKRIQRMQASCFLPVASLKLGFESVRSKLHELSENWGFQHIQIEGQMEQAAGDRVPIRLRMRGTIENAGGILATLRSFPYLDMQACRIVVDSPGPEVQMELNFDLQFTIDPEKGLNASPLQAAAVLPDEKATVR